MGRGRRPLPSSFKNQTITTTRRNKMKKTLLALLSIVIAFTAVAPAQAQDERVLAIIDTAINSNNFPSIIQEACFTANDNFAIKVGGSTLCPNGSTFMEGKGAAGNSVWPASINNPVFHGDAMVKSALTVNPNLKIVFVRISNLGKDGGTNAFSNRTIELALDWVSKNAAKYSIDAVSVSQSNLDIKRCSTDLVTIGAISSLTSNNIPVFVATGNDRRRDVVGFPSCVNGAVGVGALGNATQLEAATNTGPGLDMVALGKVRITKYNGSPTDTAGSSSATAVSAASYVSRNTSKTFGEYLTSLPKILIGTASYIRN
jgi:hypothetical protein